MQDNLDLPAVAVGHIRLHCRDLDASRAFYTGLGMRQVLAIPGVFVLELRGGTHLLLIQSPDQMMEYLDTPFDLMVSDVEEYRNQLLKAGYRPSEPTFHEIIGHWRFFVADPDGRRVPVHSSHTEGRPV